MTTPCARSVAYATCDAPKPSHPVMRGKEAPPFTYGVDAARPAVLSRSAYFVLSIAVLRARRRGLHEIEAAASEVRG